MAWTGCGRRAWRHPAWPSLCPTRTVTLLSLPLCPGGPDDAELDQMAAAAISRQPKVAAIFLHVARHVAAIDLWWGGAGRTSFTGSARRGPRWLGARAHVCKAIGRHGMSLVKFPLELWLRPASEPLKASLPRTGAQSKRLRSNSTPLEEAATTRNRLLWQNKASATPLTADSSASRRPAHASGNARRGLKLPSDSSTA